MKNEIWLVLEKLKKQSPLIHNITNYVVMNTSANALLAVGASPVMAHAEDEVEDMVKIANALVINIGTLSEKWVNAMHLALKQANALSKPTVLDPVGAGATGYRNTILTELLQAGKFSAIRGNASEILSIASSVHSTKGVDSTEVSENAIGSAKLLNRQFGSTVCISGATDYVVSSGQVVKIMNGHPLMAKITGMGCIATALIGAFIAVEKNILLAVSGAMALIGVTGELAQIISNGPGSLQMNFFDKLYSISKEEFLRTVKIETENV